MRGPLRGLDDPGDPRRAGRPRTAAALLVPLGLLAAVLPAAADRVRGITVSTHTDGREYGGPAMPATFERVRGLGANWVAIHPYAQIRPDGGVEGWRVAADRDPLAYVTRSVAQAHAAGLRILVKPHLAYWGTPFSWRGEIEFPDPARRERFWREFTDWTVAVAVASRDADAFAVGTELDRMLDDETEWRSLVGRVRAVTDAHLTYAANWTDWERVAFWDALDAVGVQAYFPLTDVERPGEAEIAAGWSRLVGRFDEASARTGKPVVLTELGYGRHFRTAAEPWAYHDDGPAAAGLQAACLRIALETIERSPAVVGSFLWKWFPEPRPAGRDFRLAAPENVEAIRRVWLGGG